MKISNRDKKLLLVLLGILVFIGCWLGVHNVYAEKAEATRSQITSLQPRLEELRDHEAKLTEYEAGIEDIAEDVTLELKKFPRDVRAEDMIMYAANMESDLGLSVGSISFQGVELLAQFDVPVEGAEGPELIPYAAMRTGLTINCDLTYTQMKKLVKYIYSTPQRTTLESISVSYNAETGGLSGNAVMSKYFMTGQDYEYVATTVPSTEKGTNNPFGTIEEDTDTLDFSYAPGFSPLPTTSPKPTPKPVPTPDGGGSGSGSN